MENKIILNNYNYILKEFKIKKKEEDTLKLIFEIFGTAEGDMQYELQRAYFYFIDEFDTQCKSVKDLVGKTINLKDPDAGILCVVEHESIVKSKIEFLSYSDGYLTIRWTGLADVYWDENFKNNLPFKIVGSAKI